MQSVLMSQKTLAVRDIHPGMLHVGVEECQSSVSSHSAGVVLSIKTGASRKADL
jgi:hypothetical protein